jgi:hypothetical protein
MKRLIIMMVLAASILASYCYAEDGLAGVPAGIKSPDDIAKWFSQDFKYQLRLPKDPITPQEVINAKGGECDDFAALASIILTRLGTPNHITAIYFSDEIAGHVICMWQEKDGTYSFMSNQEIHRSGQPTAEAAIKKFFPGARKIVADYDRTSQRRYFKMA